MHKLSEHTIKSRLQDDRHAITVAATDGEHSRMPRSKSTGVWGAVLEQIDYLRRASRYNALGIKASETDG